MPYSLECIILFARNLHLSHSIFMPQAETHTQVVKKFPLPGLPYDPANCRILAFLHSLVPLQPSSPSNPPTPSSPPLPSYLAPSSSASLDYPGRQVMHASSSPASPVKPSNPSNPASPSYMSPTSPVSPFNPV